MPEQSFSEKGGEVTDKKIQDRRNKCGLAPLKIKVYS